jgi:CRISPR-associated exonuclease Cas4
VPTFSDLARAAYCPRQLYYARRDDDRGPPAEAREVRELAFRYPELRAADDATLRDLPVERPPAEYRRALDRLAGRDYWDALVDPGEREVLLEGRDCRGIAHKVLERVGEATEEGAEAETDAGTGDGTGTEIENEGDGRAPVPVLVSPGSPPERGVWGPQSVRAVAAAKALAWERGRPVERALVEYPAHAAVRAVSATTRRKARYRTALRTVRGLDGPPPRVRDSTKCEACEYVSECGVRTRSLRSLLGL